MQFYVILNFFLCFSFFPFSQGHSHCNETLGISTCESSLAFFIKSGQNLSTIAELFNETPETIADFNSISVNSSLKTTPFLVIPLNCSCQDNGALNSIIPYTVKVNETGYTIATDTFQQLTNFSWFEEATPGLNVNKVYPGNLTNIPFNCSCPAKNELGKLEFVTYSVQPLDTLSLIASRFNSTVSAILSYNIITDPNFILIGARYFIPVNVTGKIPENPSNFTITKKNDDLNIMAIVGIIIGSSLFVIFILLLSIFLYVYFNGEKLALERRNDTIGRIYIRYFKSASSETNSESKLFKSESESESKSNSNSNSEWMTLTQDAPFPPSFVYSFQEICKSTRNFHESCKIGSGGFSVVYLGTLRGQTCAIKVMNFSATKDFHTELKILLKVQGHSNLVKIIGFSVEKTLSLVFEFVNNGTLDDHLRQRKKPVLSWRSRVSIAFDIAKGLEYLHEFLNPSVIHRDIKATNVLIDSQLNAKVADFGLTKFIHSANAQLAPSTRLVGTFGYMSPEYAQYGDASSQSDVYAFGVLLYELISAKNAILDGDPHRNTKSSPRGLPSLFEVAMSDKKSMETMLKPLIDPSLTEFYPMDQVCKMAILAFACTKFRPEQRPNMRTVVGALSCLSPDNTSLHPNDEAIFECLLED